MKKKQIKKSVHASFRPVLKKSAAFVLAFAVMVSTFTGFFPIRAHAEDTTDKGLVTNLVDQKSDLQKGVSIADTTKTDTGASYFWKSNAAYWTANISYDFKIPLDKIQAGAIDKDSTYDLGLPKEICAGATASSSIPVTANFTEPVNIDSNSNSQVTSYPIAQISISSGKATLTFNTDTFSLKNFYTSLAGTSDMEDYLPELKFSISSSISQSAVNLNELSAVPLYFGETGRQASYFTLDLQFPDSTKSDPMIDLSGQQITQTQTVSVDNQKSTFTEVSTGEIEWKAVITTNNCLESGLEFKAPLNGQTYVKDSCFYNGTQIDSSTSAHLNSDPNKDGQLTVSFANSLKTYGSQITITYRTKPAADSLKTPTYSPGQATAPASTEITGNVSVGLSGGDLAKTSAAVPFSQTWLRKKGTYNPSDQTIYWELIFNENGRTLTNAVLHDTLDQNQTLVQQQVFVSTKSNYNTSGDTTVWQDTTVTTEGSGFQIHLSDKYPTINSPLYISYLTKVKPSFFDQENAETAKISNDAHVEFTTEKGEAASFGPGPQSVMPGVSPISKKGVYNPSDQTITWTVTLNEAFAEWTHVTVTIPIDTVENQLYLDGIDPSNQATTDEDTDAAKGITVQTGSFDANTNNWIWSNESENKAAVTVSTKPCKSGETAEAKSTITVQWANPVSTPVTDEFSEPQPKVQPIKAPKQITFTTHLVNARDYSGNTSLPAGNDTSSIKPYNITPHLVVNPGPDPADKFVNTADTNPTPDSSRHQGGRFVVTSYQKATNSTDPQDENGNKLDNEEKKLISGYQYEKWDAATDAASFAKDADKNSVQAYSQMLSCNVVNATNNPYNYHDQSLEFQLTVNQNKQTSIDGYSIQDTLPQNMEYKGITSAYTTADTADGGTTKNTLTVTGGTVNGITESNSETPASDPARQTVKFLFSNNVADSKTLVFTFKVQFPDGDAVAKMALDGTKTKRNFTLTNDAALYNGLTDVNAHISASTTVDSMMISKTILKSNPNTHRIQYQILVNKVGATLNSGNSIPIIDTLPEGMQLISGSVSIRPVAIAPDGSYDYNSADKESQVPPTKLSSTGTNYNYQSSNDSSGTPHGVMTVNLNGDYLTKPCMITYEIEVGTLIQGGEYANVASYNGEEDSENSGGNVRATTTLQSIDEATSLATSDRAVVKIQKTDKDTGVPLAGAHFAVSCKDSTISMLKDPGDNKFAEVLTNSGGYAVFRLPLGNSYQIKEVDPPSGYTKDTDSVFSNDGAPITLSSSDGGVVYQWDGSKFTSDTDAKTVPVTNQRNDNSSITFYVQTNPSQSSNSASSTSSPASSAASTGSSSSSSAESSSSSSVPSETNNAKWTMGTMPLHGAGAITSDLPGHPLKGAVYGLYVNDSCDTPVKDAKGNVMTATSDSNGKLEFTNLAWGAATPYYIKEITPPKLFKPRNKIIYKAVLKTENDVTFSGGDLAGTAHLIISYDPQIGDSTINVKKVGEDTGDVGLAGARFDLYTKEDGNYFQSGTTISGMGIASLTKLPAGDYTLKEAAPPSGYAAAGDQDISVKKAGDTINVKVTDTVIESNHMTVQMKFDKSSDDQVVQTERNFIIRLQNGDGTPRKGTFTYQRSDGKSGTLNFDTENSSSSPSSSITNHSAALRRAGGFASSDSTAVLPMKGNTDAIVNIPNGTHFTVVAPEIAGYDLKKSGDDATVSTSNKAPALFDYTKQAGTNSSSSNSSGSSSNPSGPSSNSGTSSNASSQGTNPSGGTTSNNAGAGTQTGSSGSSNGTNNGTAAGTSGTNGTAGSTRSISSAVKSNSNSLPKTNVPDTLPFWSIGLALSSIATVLVIRWGIRKRKRERNRRDS